MFRCAAGLDVVIVRARAPRACRYPGARAGLRAARGPAERRCIRWHAVFSVLVERRGWKAPGGSVCLACGGRRCERCLHRVGNGGILMRSVIVGAGPTGLYTAI